MRIAWGTLRMRSSRYSGESLGSAAVPTYGAAAAEPRAANPVCCTYVVGGPKDSSSPTLAEEQPLEPASGGASSPFQCQKNQKRRTTAASFDISGDDDDCEIMLVLVDLVSDDEAEENAKSIETDDDVILEISMWFPRGSLGCHLESVSTWIPLDFSIDEGPSSQPIQLEEL